MTTLHGSWLKKRLDIFSTRFLLLNHFFYVLACLACLYTVSGCAGKPVNQAERINGLILPAAWDTPHNEGGVAWQSLLDLVQSQELRPLVNKAMDNNPNLKLMAVSLKEAGAFVQKLSGSRLPGVDATLGGNQTRKDSVSTERYNISMGVSWELDVWGRLADAEAAGQKNEEAIKEDYQAAKNSLSGNLIKEWFNYITLGKMVHIERNRLLSFDGNQKVIQERYMMGLGNLQDLEAAKTTAASTASTLENRRLALKKSRRMIQTYLGNIKLEKISIPRELPLVKTPVASIPGETLGLRPDLKSAFANIQAADLNSRVAYKAMLPGFTLNPAVALSGTSPSGMLQASPMWDFLGKMIAPLFRGGQLKADMDIAGYKAEKAYWVYKNKLVSAVVEVENRLAIEKSLMIQQRQLARALTHATRNRNNYQERYRQGLTDILNLLTAQQTAFSLEVRLLDVKRNLLCNRIDLGLALGLGV